MTRQRPVVEALEPRILYSADAGLTLGLAPDALRAASEIVLVDERTPDYALLLQDIAAQSGRRLEPILIDAQRDGLEQVAEALAGREHLAAVHIIAHGREGMVQLGNTLVSAETLERNAGLVETWSKALGADADILLYGCDLAATAQGRQLVEALARLTGADVSASDDATGHASLGGDWDLEFRSGAIDVPVVPSAGAQEAWSHLLSSVVLVANEPPFGDMPDNAYEIAGGVTYTQSFSHTSGGGTYTVGQIDLVLYRNASANGADVTVELRTDTNVLLASGSVARASLGTSENWVTVSLAAPATLTDGLVYHIQVKGTGPGNVFVGVDDTGTYPDGNFINDGTPEPGKDMAFRVVAINAPVVDLNGGGAGQDEFVTFTEQTPALIAPAGTLADPDSANLASLTVTLTARPDGDAVESLSLNAAATAAASGAGLTVSYTPASGVLSITGSASVAIYQTILQGVQYDSTSDAPTATSRSVTVVAHDGALASATQASSITITPVNDAPVVTASGGATGFSENAAPVPVDGALAVSDADSPTLAAATVSIGAGFQAGEDLLGFVADPATMGNIAGSYDPASGVLSLSSSGASATLAQWQAALRAVTYVNTSDAPGVAVRTVSFSIDDGSAGSAASTQSVTVTAVNDAPVVSASGGTTSFAAAAVTVDSAVSVSDADNATLAAATVAISAGFQAAEDALGFTGNPATMGNIAGSYDPATGVLSLSSAGASATLAQWQAALGSVTYTNSSATPSAGVRTVSFQVSDGSGLSAMASQDVSVAPPAPVATTTPPPPPAPEPPPPVPPVVVTPPPVLPAPGAAPAASGPAPAATPQASGGAGGMETTFAASPDIQIPVVSAEGAGHLPSAAAGTTDGVPGFRLAAPGGAAAPGAEAEGDLLGDAARQVTARTTDLLQPQEQGRSGAQQGESDELAALRDSVREQDAIQQQTVVVLAAGSLSMTLAYLLWLVRGGALAASVLAALPAWRLLDPLPVLPQARGSEDDEPDADEDESIAAFSEAPQEAKRA